MKSQVLHTVWCNISGEAAGEICNWSLLGVKAIFCVVCLCCMMTMKTLYSCVKCNQASVWDSSEWTGSDRKLKSTRIERFAFAETKWNRISAQNWEMAFYVGDVRAWHQWFVFIETSCCNFTKTTTTAPVYFRKAKQKYNWGLGKFWTCLRRTGCNFCSECEKIRHKSNVRRFLFRRSSRLK